MLHFFCALPCEAQAIIQHFKLSELKQNSLFRLYQSHDEQYSLVITSIGKLNAAAAVSYHHACFNTSIDDIWLNVGVAGHKEFSVGEARLIHKITDGTNKDTWYPQILFKPACPGASLITLDTPSTDYQDSLFDMEASGFYAMASRLGTSELIHCLKCISDNEKQTTATINADSVKKLIAGHITTIESTIDSLNTLARELTSLTSEPKHYQSCIEQWRFTQSERIQLRRLLRQWSIRLPEKDVMQSVNNLKNAKAIIKEISTELANTAFSIHD